MSMDLALRARLIAQPSIASKVANGSAVSLDERPASLGFPAVVLTLVSPGEEWTHDGPDGLNLARWQFDYFGLEVPALIALRDAVHAEMQQLRDVDGVRFHEGMLLSSFATDPETLDGGQRVYRRLQEFEFYWESLS